MPIVLPPPIGFEHSQGQDVRYRVWVPPGPRDFETDLHNMAVSTLDFAARAGPALLAILRVGHRVFVALEIVGRAADGRVLGSFKGK